MDAEFLLQEMFALHHNDVEARLAFANLNETHSTIRYGAPTIEDNETIDRTGNPRIGDEIGI